MLPDLKDIYDIIKDLKGNIEENKQKIDELWETTENTIQIHPKLKYTFGKLILNAQNKIIILSGVGGYGKTTAIHTIFDKFEDEKNKIIYDRRNYNDWIRLKNGELYDNNFEFVIVDNFRELKQNELDIIKASIIEKRIILVCRESNISISNEYTVLLNVNDFNFSYSKEKIDKKLLKVLPSFLKVPLYYNLLSDFKYNTKDAINLINLYSTDQKNENQHEFVNDFLDIVFENLSDNDKELLTLFAMIVSDTIYDNHLLGNLLRKIDLSKYTSIDDNIFDELKELLNKYSVFINTNINSKYFHSILSDYFIDRFKINRLRIDFWNGVYFQSVLANINWKLEAGISQPFHKKVEYISYARNIIDFCIDYFDEIIENANDIRLVKNILNFLNSYSYIYVKTFTQVSEIEFLKKLQGIVVNAIKKDCVEKEWKKKLGDDHYNYSKAQFYTVSSKVNLCLAVNGNEFSIVDYEEALKLCDESKCAFSLIMDEKKKNIREDVYCYTKSMILYKGALFFDNFEDFECDNKIINSKYELLNIALEYISDSEAKAIKDIKFNYSNLDFDFESYNIAQFNNIKDEIKVSKTMGSYFSTLELKCIIKSQLATIRPDENKDLDSMLRFTSNGFYSVIGNASQNDKMRFREVLLMQLLFENNEETKNKIIEILESEKCGIKRVENFEDRRFVFLKALAFKYIDLDITKWRADYNLIDWGFLTKPDVNKIDLWNTLFKLLIS